MNLNNTLERYIFRRNVGSRNYLSHLFKRFAPRQTQMSHIYHIPIFLTIWQAAKQIRAKVMGSKYGPPHTLKF